MNLDEAGIAIVEAFGESAKQSLTSYRVNVSLFGERSHVVQVQLSASAVVLTSPLVHSGDDANERAQALIAKAGFAHALSTNGVHCLQASESIAGLTAPKLADLIRKVAASADEMESVLARTDTF